MTMTASVLRPSDVAELWHCSEAHVRTLIRTGKLPAFRIGSKLLRVSRSDVEEYERCQKQNTASSDTEDYSPSSGKKMGVADAVRLVRITAPRPMGNLRASSK